MEELPQSSNELLSLSKKVLTKEIELKEFLDTVLEKDQSNPDRMSSLEAADILLTPEIIAAYDDSEQRSRFYWIRSLTLFHKAQIRLLRGESRVQDDLLRALQDSTESSPEYEDWGNYIKATISYLNNNLDELRTLESEVILNKSIVQNFIQGLEERGYPDYLIDYAKERE